MTRSVYLDYNATVPPRPEAVAAVAEALTLTGNASSVHGFGRRVRRNIEDARDAVAGLVGAQPTQVIFTSGGTEANNLALCGVSCQRTLVSAGEHDSVLSAVAGAKHIPLKPDGVIDLSALESLLVEESCPTLISVMLANNETGVIQPIAEVVAVARRHKALVHTDAVQAAGKIPIDMAALDVDLLSISAHKIGGPQGSGALIVRDGVGFDPIIRGGGQERRRRGGTENAAGIAGFGAAARIATTAPAQGSEPAQGAETAVLRDDLERRLKELAPEVVIFGDGAPRLGNTTCFALPGLPAETQVMALDLAGVAVSSGAACSSGKVAPSHVLTAMGASVEQAASALRVSFGWQSVAEDVESFLAAWGALYSRHDAVERQSSSAA